MLGKIRLLLLIGAGVLGYMFFVDYKDAKVYKNPKTYTMTELEAMPKDQIPKYFILTGAASTGDHVIYEVTKRRRRGASTKSNYIYYPIASVTQDNKLKQDSCARFFVCKSTGSVQKDLTEKMLDEDFAKITAKYDGDKIEKGIIDEFSKMDIKTCSEPIVLLRDSVVPKSDGKMMWILICALVLVLMIGSYVYDFKE